MKNYRYLVAVAVAGGLGLQLTAMAGIVERPAMHGAGGGGGAILPVYDDVSTNWKNAGLTVVGGIPTRNTQCGSTISPSGLIPPQAGDDASLINAAISACPSGQVVKLVAGTFQLDMSEYINLNKQITLRGAATCNNSSSPYCQSVINVYNGALPYTDTCGVDLSHVVACVSNSGILMTPTTLYDWGWGGSSCYPGEPASECGTTVAVDVARGAKTVQVADTSHFAVGMFVRIDEASGAGWVTDPITTGSGSLYGQVWASSDFLNASGGPATGRVAWKKHNPALAGDDFGSGSYPTDTGNFTAAYTWFPDRATAEIHLISAIGAGPCPGTNCTLTFDDPLTIAMRQSGGHNAQVYWPTHQNGAAVSLLQYAGVENISVLRTNQAPGILMDFCAYCWLKNVEVAGWTGGGVDVENSVRDQIDTTYIHNSYWVLNNGGEYPFDMESGATEILFQNSITRLGGKGMTTRAGGAGSVVAYNYEDDQYYQGGAGATSLTDIWIDAGVNGSHFAGSHHVLFEGNWGVNGDNDFTHGNNVYLTYFRNWLTGYRSTFVDPSNGVTVNDAANLPGTPNNNGPLITFGPQAWDYWHAYIGNVLGTSGLSTTGNGWVYKGTYNSFTPSIYWLGWVGDAANGTAIDPNLTAGSGAYILLHGNYDYVNATVEWDPGTPNHTLPTSFYLSSAPAFFSVGASCTYTWPWVNPIGSPLVYGASGAGPCSGYSGLPAKARWDAGTPFIQP